MAAEEHGAEAAPKLAPALAEVLPIAAAAWERLCAGQSLDRALEAALQTAAAPSPGSEERRGGAVRDIASNAVRHRGMLEYLLGALLRRPPEAAVGALLAVSLAQLMVRSYSDFTLVDQSVRAARSRPETAGAAGLVNAVLREFLRRRDVLEEQAAGDPARRYNVPPWWLRRLQAEYGTRAIAILTAQREEPPLVLRVNCRRATLAGVLGELCAAGFDASPVGRSALWLHRAVAVERIPGFAAGLVSVQDAGAQLAAPFLGAEKGMRVLDACAAPGGKTAHLLEISDCLVDAVEMDAQRAGRIDSNIRRLGLAGERVRVLVADVLQPAAYWDGAPYERILLDAPCTASGVVRRHPDVVWLRRPADVAKLATRQAEMLRVLWPLLAPAGRLLYVVCSVFAEEGRRQVAAFVRRQPGARLVRFPPAGPAGLQLLPNTVASAMTKRDDVAKPDDLAMRPLPLLHDGFFFALLEKT